jgi:hypothetical protein
MSDAPRRLSVRLSVDGAQQTRQEPTPTGEAGDQMLARIVPDETLQPAVMPTAARFSATCSRRTA